MAIDWFFGQVGNDTTVRIIANGDMGPKQIEGLIRILQVQRSVLEDDVPAPEDSRDE